MLRFLLGARRHQEHTIRVEGAEIEFNQEVLLPEVSRAMLDQGVTVLSIAVLEGIRFVRVTSHLIEEIYTVSKKGQGQD